MLSAESNVCLVYGHCLLLGFRQVYRWQTVFRCLRWSWYIYLLDDGISRPRIQTVVDQSQGMMFAGASWLRYMSGISSQIALSNHQIFYSTACSSYQECKHVRITYLLGRGLTYVRWIPPKKCSVIAIDATVWDLTCPGATSANYLIYRAVYWQECLCLNHSNQTVFAILKKWLPQSECSLTRAKLTKIKYVCIRIGVYWISSGWMIVNGYYQQPSLALTCGHDSPWYSILGGLVTASLSVITAG